MEPPPLEYSIFIREVTGNLPEFPSCEKQPYSEGRWFYVELHCRNYGPPGPGAIGIVNDNGRLGSVAWMHSLFVTEWVRRPPPQAEGYPEFPRGKPKFARR